MYWFARFHPTTGVIIGLVLIAVGLQRITLGIATHAPVVVGLGGVVIALACVLIWRTVRIPTTVSEE